MADTNQAQIAAENEDVKILCKRVTELQVKVRFNFVTKMHGYSFDTACLTGMSCSFNFFLILLIFIPNYFDKVRK